MSFTITFEPTGTRLLCDKPIVAAEAVRRSGILLRAECGGKGLCGKCRVRIDGPCIPPATRTERDSLTAGEVSDGWRLACRTTIDGSTLIYIPPATLAKTQALQTEGMGVTFEPNPAVTWVSLSVPRPTLEAESSLIERLTGALKQNGEPGPVTIDLPALRDVARAAADGRGRFSVALTSDHRIITAHVGNVGSPIGLAVDLGTTKIACFLVDLESGRTIATRGVVNPQVPHGEDIMSRLERVLVDSEFGTKFQSLVVGAIGDAAAMMCHEVERDLHELLEVCLVGNTAMHHLLLRLPVRSLALSPFVPVIDRPLELGARDLGLLPFTQAAAYIPPPIAGFVGSDHLAFLLASGFGRTQRTCLGIDVGTNTEVALEAGGRLLCCSTASGPAFEGAHIGCGMRAAPGAIERVSVGDDGKVELGVIGDERPVGVCGSGVLDALAELRRVGSVNHRGRLVEGSPGVRRSRDGVLEFLLATGCDDHRDVVMTQRDINELLLAKGAIRAGINMLMDRLGVEPGHLDQIIIGGAFGSHLDPENAMRINLIPKTALERVSSVGNAAGVGARLILTSLEARGEAERLAGRVKHVELAVDPTFHKQLARAMRLPGL